MRQIKDVCVVWLVAAVAMATVARADGPWIELPYLVSVDAVTPLQDPVQKPTKEAVQKQPPEMLVLPLRTVRVVEQVQVVRVPVVERRVYFASPVYVAPIMVSSPVSSPVFFAAPAVPFMPIRTALGSFIARRSAARAAGYEAAQAYRSQAYSSRGQGLVIIQ